MILNKKITHTRVYTFLIIVLAVTVAFGVYQYRKNQDYRQYISNQNSLTFYSLVDYVENMEVSLSKAMLTSSPESLGIISSEIWKDSVAAHSNLTRLPISHKQLDKTSKFLTQVGDYCYSISQKVPYTDKITQEQFDKIEDLHDYSRKLSVELNKLREEFHRDKLTFKVISNKSRDELSNVEAKQISTKQLENIEKNFQEYPVLIYDGPFSEHIEKMSPRMLRDKKDISKEQAKKIAAEFLGSERSKGIKFSGEGNGKIKTYNFVVEKDDNRINIDITKKGGYVLYMLDNTLVSKTRIKYSEAIKKAKNFLESKGYKDMKESYYEKNGHVLTINFAYKYDDVTVYTDLIKVKVSLNEGTIMGFESRGYIMSHEDQKKLPKIKVSEAEAKEKLNKKLKIVTSNLAVIPLESKREVLCHEFTGKYKDRQFLVYINVESGKQEQILMIIKSDKGYLTI